ncbi:Xaa-Pro aminopeptidase [Evansella vedderi]|uniref:Xaa-Pro aminopeptidase n=1 Tax=Evansella vedderi TaxID=38282 RepID=A0ABT9ZPA7_9BACI|nr:Xaa-Pro peptidase family protein [Evansella vedderi]MDQ0253072.1 Xaa-Pro aminopeptidase [Evansella vedderi]
MKLRKLREKLSQLGLDGMLVTNQYNRRYISDFTGSAGVLLISPSEAKLLVDGRYTDQAMDQAKEFEIVQSPRNLLQAITDQVEQMGIKRLGYEADHLSVTQFNQYKDNINAELAATSKIIETLRIVKTEDELVQMRGAAQIAEKAFQHILTVIKPGITERDISAELIFQMQKLGASGPANDPIVASGWRSALPHGRATDKVIENGDILTMDFGAIYNGYLSDMTRTLAIGEPPAELKKIYNIVLDTLEHSKEKAMPGVTPRELDKFARDYLDAQGYGKYFIHSIGHGLGLDLHEDPFSSSEEVFEENMVFTIEPGVYISGLGGVRIEDDVVIKKDGVEVLTPSNKKLIIL